MTASAPTFGGYNETDMRRILRQACDAVGLDSEGAHILRGHTNAVVRLQNNPVVVKIARRGSRHGNVARTVRFVRWLMDRGFPTVRLLPVPQPITVDGGHLVTLWEYIPQPDHEVRAEQLAAPLLTLHELPAPPVDLPVHDNVTAIHRSLDSIHLLPETTLAFLRARLEQLAAELKAVTYHFPDTVLQGDPQHRNALHAHPRTLLCDWDTVSWGHCEWDLVTVEIHCRRFGHGNDHYKPFADAYGFDITDWPGFPILRDLRELRMITTNARKIPNAPHTRPEIERRIEGLHLEDASMLWNIL
ncbi:hypothetical protein T261_0721 [Streptomyces lydicus]|nr:hypothetical protein T261_0721 [Streptomyces lydicus]